MQAGSLNELLQLFKLLSQPNAVVDDYKMMQISRRRLSARTPSASLDILARVGITDPIFVETNMLASIVASLPAKDEIEFRHEGSELHWACGAARGRLATKPAPEHKAIPDLPDNSISCPSELGSVISLGSLAASTSALASIGLFGVALVPRDDRLWALSCDNTTLAAANCRLAAGTLPQRVTLAAADAGLIEELAKRKDVRIAFSEQSVFFADTTLRAAINYVPPLRQDLWALVENYFGDDAQMPIPKERVAAFVKRATQLSESRQRCEVQVKAADDRLQLQFSETLAHSEEYYLIDGFDVPEPCEVTVDAFRLGKALQHCDVLLLDNLARRALVFRAKDSSFLYLISGRAKAERS